MWLLLTLSNNEYSWPMNRKFMNQRREGYAKKLWRQMFLELTD